MTDLNHVTVNSHLDPELAAYIERLVDAAPPLTPAGQAHLAKLIHSSLVEF